MTTRVPAGLTAITDAWTAGEQHGPTFIMSIKKCNRAKALEHAGKLVALGIITETATRQVWART